MLDVIGRHEEAKRLYLEAASSNRPQDRLLASRTLAETALTEGKKDEAILWLKRALEIKLSDPRSAAMLKRLGGTR